MGSQLSLQRSGQSEFLKETCSFYQLTQLIRQATWSAADQLVQAEGVGSVVLSRKLWARRNRKSRLTSTQAPTAKLRCLRCPGPSPFLQKLPRPGSCLHQCPVQYLLVYQFLTYTYSQRNKSCFINLDETGSCRGWQEGRFRNPGKKRLGLGGNAFGWVPSFPRASFVTQ